MQISLALSLANPLITGGGGLPSGYTWTTYGGERVYYNGVPVFDDGVYLYCIGEPA